MDFGILGLILDVAVLACLGATIFFALRLSKSLNNFKTYRQEFTDLVGVLSQNIDQAQRAVINLKDGSHETADELKNLMKKSRLLMDELQLINDAGNSLATRLEGLAQKSSRGAAPQTDSWFGEEDEEEDLDEFMRQEMQDEPFSIHDPDFDEPAAPSSVKTFQSQAERELYQALLGNKKSGKI